MTFPALFAACQASVRTGYPLRDDGTVAASYGLRAMPANAPDYTTCDVTYDATLTQRLAAPTAGASVSFQALSIADGPWHIEMKLAQPPQPPTSPWGSVGVMVVPSTAGVLDPAHYRMISVSNLAGVEKVRSIVAYAGALPVWGEMLVSSTLADYRISIDVDTDGSVTYRCTDGLYGAVGAVFAGYDAVTVFMALAPDIAANGCAVQISLIDKAADVTLTAIANAKALDRKVI